VFFNIVVACNHFFHCVCVHTGLYLCVCVLSVFSLVFLLFFFSRFSVLVANSLKVCIFGDLNFGDTASNLYDDMLPLVGRQMTAK